MKFCSFAAIAVSAAVLAIACANSAPAQETKVRWNAPPEEWQWVVESAAPGCKHETIKSKAMDREVGYNVFLPPGYDKDGEKRYPVVYFLHLSLIHICL